MPIQADVDLHAVLDRDRDRGWQTFVEQYTPAILAALERLGVRDRDEAMDLYVLVCERLAAHDCDRLRRHDPAQGSLAAWLTVVVRHVAVDWVRSRAGRRRVFAALTDLDAFHQQVFQLYYWRGAMPSAIAESLGSTTGRRVTLVEVLGALDAIHERLTSRHYAELVAMAARSAPAASLEAEMAGRGFDAADPAPSPEGLMRAGEQDAALEAALAGLPAEDAAIVRLYFLQSLSLAETQRALHLPSLTRARVASIVAALRAALAPPVAVSGVQT